MQQPGRDVGRRFVVERSKCSTENVQTNWGVVAEIFLLKALEGVLHH